MSISTVHANNKILLEDVRFAANCVAPFIACYQVKGIIDNNRKLKEAQTESEALILNACVRKELDATIARRKRALAWNRHKLCGAIGWLLGNI